MKTLKEIAINAEKMETLFNFINFGIILEKSGQTWHGTTIDFALSAAAEDLPLDEIEGYLASIYRKFDTDVGIPFDFYGVKIAEHDRTQVFLTKAGNIILVCHVVDKVEFETAINNNDLTETVKAVNRKYIFNCIQKHEFHELRDKLSLYLPTETYAEICKQMEIDYVEHLE